MRIRILLVVGHGVVVPSSSSGRAARLYTGSVLGTHVAASQPSVGSGMQQQRNNPNPDRMGAGTGLSMAMAMATVASLVLFHADSAPAAESAGGSHPLTWLQSDGAA